MQKYNHEKFQILKKRAKKNPNLIKLLEKLEEKYGDDALYYVGGGNKTIVSDYSSIVLPNGGSVQSFITTGNAVPNSISPVNKLVSKNYNFGLSLYSQSVTNMPQINFCIFTESSFLSTSPLATNHGYSVGFGSGTGSGTNIQTSNIYNGLGITTIGNSIPGVNLLIYFKEINNKLTIAYGSPAIYIVQDLDMTNIYNSVDRYMQIFRTDGGVTGVYMNILLIPSII